MVNKDLQIGDFATYTKVAGTKYEDNYYRVKQFTRHNSQPAVLTTIGVEEVKSVANDTTKVVKHLIRVNGAETVLGNALTAPVTGHEGSGATGSETYILGAYRGAGTDVFSDPSLARGVINTAKAEWLNATGNKEFDDVDSAEDLLDLENVDFSKVELDILLNEKPDSDGFRTAYLIVLKSVNGSVTPGSGPWYSNVRTDSPLKGVSADFHLDTAAWAAVGATARVDVTVYIDGVASGTTTIGLTPNAAGDKMIASHRFFANTDLSGHKVTFTKGTEKYSAVKVRYLNGDGATPVEVSIANATATLSSTAAGTLTFTWQTTDTTSATLKVSTTGLTANVTNVATNNGSGVGGTNRTYTNATAQALGTNFVDVTIKDINTLTAETYTVNVSDTTPDLTAATQIKNYVDVGEFGDAETETLSVKVVENTGTAGASATGLHIGDNVVFELSMSDEPADPRVNAYLFSLELTLTDGSKITVGPVKMNSTATDRTLSWTVTSAATVTDVIVDVVENHIAETGSAEAGRNYIDVKFSGKVTAVDAAKVKVFNAVPASVTVLNAVPYNNNYVRITVAGTVAAGWTAIIAADAVTLEAPSAARLARADANNGIALFTEGGPTPVEDWKDDTVVYVVVLEAATGDTLTGEVEVTSYGEAKPDEQPGSPDGPGEPDNPDQGGQTDAEKVAAAKTAIEGLTLTFDKTKNTPSSKENIKSAVQTQIINAAKEAGVTVTAEDISVSITSDATDGASGSPSGTAGSATATVNLTLNEATDAAAVTIKINAPAYEAPSEG